MKKECCNLSCWSLIVPEFIHLIASEANEVCEKTTKKMITGEHILQAVENLGFNEYLDELREVYTDHRQQIKVPKLYNVLIRRLMIYNLLFWILKGTRTQEINGK